MTDLEFEKPNVLFKTRVPLIFLSYSYLQH
jgi:hypothetical protein